MSKISIEEQLACARRELRLGRVNYPRWVSTGKMDERESEREIGRMGAIVRTLERLAAQMDLFEPEMKE